MGKRGKTGDSKHGVDAKCLQTMTRLTEKLAKGREGFEIVSSTRTKGHENVTWPFR